MTSFSAELKAKNCVVLGGGVTGKSVAKYLEKYAAKVTIVDERSNEVGVSNAISEELIADIDLVIVSPGWKIEHPFVRNLSEKNIPILSEIDLAWQIKSELQPNQCWIGLTGTNGKTTTIQMVESIFMSAHINGVACGNVGETVIDAVLHQPPYDVLALELSSFQLEWSKLPIFSAGAILNIAEDHLDWHGSMDSYISAKQKLIDSSKIVLINGGDEVCSTKLRKNKSGEFYQFTLNAPKIGELGVVENLLIDRAFNNSPDAEVLAELSDITPLVPHNILNALAAAGLCRAIGIQATDIQKGLQNFKIDRHRFETVHVENEIKWINDSKATNPHAAEAAMKSLTSIIWIAGGLAKGASMERLIKMTKHNLKAAILIGTDGPLIAKTLTEFAPEIPIMTVDSSLAGAVLMNEVVQIAKSLAVSGDTVLLAPACASMDRFVSYADRGNAFVSAVTNLVANA